jgi:hypothetical protein
LLSKLVPKLDEPALFWLDGHYSGQNTYGKDDECPILDELNTFHATSVEHFLMIDDARLFLAPPPYPHVHEQWPTIVEIIQLLLSINGTYYVTVIDDVIFAIPKYGKDIMTSYFQEQATRNWKAHLAITRERQNLVTQGNQQKSIKFLVNQLLKKPIK